MNYNNLVFLLLLLCLQFNGMAEGRIEKSFNHDWQFKKGPFPKDEIAFMQSWEKKWSDVNIPHTWNAKDMQEKHDNFYAGEAYYRKPFFAQEEMKGKRLFLRFEGVGQVAELYINGSFVGNHKGGYSAFSFDISNAITYGEDNEILLKVNNASRPDVIPVNHNLFGVYGGIYRPVSLIVTNKTNIAVTDDASAGVYVTQNNVSEKHASIQVRVKLVNKELQQKQLTLVNTILNKNGDIVDSNSQKIVLTTHGIQTWQHQFNIKKPHLWQGRKSPYLYRVETVLKDGSKVIDNVTQPLGIRKVEVIAGKGVFLNDQKYPMYGVCRHQDWWTLGSALSNKHHDTDLALMMEMGVTTVRLAHYQQSDYFYSKCDSLGILVWAEIPFVNRVSKEEGPNAKSQLRELIKQSFNHPSIYTWGLHNEVYHPHDYTARLTQELHQLAKAIDPDRYTVAVNGYGHMEHPVNLNADIQGMNRYFGWYEKTIPDIAGWVKGLEQNYPNHKVMLTEYGADANIHHQTEYIGNTIRWWDDYFPETYQTKMHEIQWGVIEKHPYITASYLWNMFDFCVPMWKRGGVEARNLKGLITFDRKVKKDAFYWYKANWSEEDVLYLTQRRNTDREKKLTSVTVYSNVGVPKLYVNGKEITNVKQGTTNVHFIFEDVLLQEGINNIKTVAGTNHDQIEWSYSGEKKRESQGYENNNAHFGF